MSSVTQMSWLQRSLQMKVPDPSVCHPDLQVLSSDSLGSGTAPFTTAHGNGDVQRTCSTTTR